MKTPWPPVKGERLLPNERWLLYWLAHHTASKFEKPTVVNIGVSWGASLHCLYAGAPDAWHLAIDIDLDWRPVMHPEILQGVEFQEGDSYRLGRKYTRGTCLDTIHLLFVDGGHHYKNVRGDLETWGLCLVSGGIAAFHDYAPAECDIDRFNLRGVKRAVDEWHRGDDRLEFVGTVDSIAVIKRL